MKKYRLVKDLPYQPADDENSTHWTHNSDNQRDGNWHFNRPGRSIMWNTSWGHPVESGWFEEVKPERFVPEMYQEYWQVRVQRDGVSTYRGTRTMMDNYQFCFRTQEQAEEAAKRVKATLLAYHDELLES